LLVLTDIELAYLTPVRNDGYCFAFTGGKCKKLKGILSYYKVDIGRIARAITHFDVLWMQQDIVIILHGNMMPEQQQRAQEKNKIRVEYVMAAMEWLIENNREWQYHNINLDEIRQSLQDPILIDRSNLVDSGEDKESSNIKKTETFYKYFPNGSMTSLMGGQQDLQEYQTLCEQCSRMDSMLKGNAILQERQWLTTETII
jgi:hypothetical protein